MRRFRNCSEWRGWTMAALVGGLLLRAATGAHAQTFCLEHVNDSLGVLTLTTDSTIDRREVPFPVYRFCTGDLNGDGLDEALLGVVKPTRFFPQPARRLFIFKNVHGRIRPLWLGSKLGGTLLDFRLSGPLIVCLATDGKGHYYVMEYELGKFGLNFRRYLAEGAGEEEASRAFDGGRQ